MGEVTALAPPFRKRIERRHGRAGMGVAELDVIVHEIADGLNQRPALRDLAKRRPGEFRQAVGFAVTASEEVDERVNRQSLERALRGLRCDFVGVAAVLH